MIPHSPRTTSAADAEYFEPLDRTPQAVQETCMDAVLRWQMLAIGQRPQDWLAHDLLLGRLLRDPRLWMFHQAIREPADWMWERLSHLGIDAAQAATTNARGIQLTVLHYYHLVRLYLARDWVLDDQSHCDPPYLLRRWQRLWDCPPCGAEYEKRPGARPCDMVQLCPWCRARRGVELWRRLRAGLSSGAPDPELVLLRQFVTSEWITPPDIPPGYSATSAVLDRANRCHTELDEDDPRDDICLVPPAEERQPVEPGDVYARLTSRQMAAARTKLSDQLHDWASRLQLRDGCTILTVEPAIRTTDHGDQYRQHLWWGHLLAPRPSTCADPELWDWLERHTLRPTDYPADERTALEIGPARRLLTDALGWPSVCLWDAWQWWHYHVQTWHRPLYVPFGDWRQQLAEPVKPDPFARPPARKLALLRGNQRRKKAAAVRTDNILEFARPLWAQIQAEARPSRRGRPAHRERLRELLKDQGILVTDWQLRRLLAALRKTPNGGRS